MLTPNLAPSLIVEAATARPTPNDAPARPTDVAAARQAGEEFEAMFLGQMIAHMFAGVSDGGPFGGGHAEGLYRSMMHEEYGRAIARAGGVGVADAVMKQILQLQEAGQS